MCDLIGNYKCSCDMAVFNLGWRMKVQERTAFGIIPRVPAHDPVWPEGEDIVKVCQCGNRLSPGGLGHQHGYWELCPETRSSMTEAGIAQGLRTVAPKSDEI